MAKQGSDSAAPVAATAAAADASKPVHVMELLKQFDFLSIGLGGKIHCALTNRDLPLNSVAIQQHVNSKKLKKEREWYNADFSKYEPLIVVHKTNPKLLFCKLTQIELNRIPKEVEAHVNGKRYRNRKAEKEGLKQGQRQPLKEGSDEEEEEEEEEGEDGPGFWAPSAGEEVEDMDEDDESDLEGEEEEEEEEKEEEGGEANGAGASRRAKANGNKAGARKGGGEKGGGRKGGKPKKEAKGKREEGGRDGEGDGESGGGGRAKGKNGNQKGGAKKKKQAEKGGAKSAAQREKKSRPLSDDTLGVSNTAAESTATPTALPSPSAKKAKNKNKARSTNKKGGGTPGGERVVGAATSAGKRKHKVSEEPASNGKKKRKS